jgi:hypothetical protein
MTAKTNPPLVFHNKTAAFYWIFIGLFDTGVLSATWLFFRDQPNLSIWWLVYFWAGAIGASWWAARKQYIQVNIAPNNAKIIKFRPFKKEVFYFGSKDVKRIEVIRSQDSEGDPYFICELELYQTVSIRVAEGHHQPMVDLVAEQLRQSLNLTNDN